MTGPRRIWNQPMLHLVSLSTSLCLALVHSRELPQVLSEEAKQCSVLGRNPGVHCKPITNPRWNCRFCGGPWGCLPDACPQEAPSHHGMETFRLEGVPLEGSCLLVKNSDCINDCVTCDKDCQEAMTKHCICRIDFEDEARPTEPIVSTPEKDRGAPLEGGGQAQVAAERSPGQDSSKPGDRAEGISSAAQRAEGRTRGAWDVWLIILLAVGGGILVMTILVCIFFRHSESQQRRRRARSIMRAREVKAAYAGILRHNRRFPDAFENSAAALVPAAAEGRRSSVLSDDTTRLGKPVTSPVPITRPTFPPPPTSPPPHHLSFREDARPLSAHSYHSNQTSLIQEREQEIMADSGGMIRTVSRPITPVVVQQAPTPAAYPVAAEVLGSRR